MLLITHAQPNSLQPFTDQRPNNKVRASHSTLAAVQGFSLFFVPPPVRKTYAHPHRAPRQAGYTLTLQRASAAHLRAQGFVVSASRNPHVRISMVGSHPRGGKTQTHYLNTGPSTTNASSERKEKTTVSTADSVRPSSRSRHQRQHLEQTAPRAVARSSAPGVSD